MSGIFRLGDEKVRPGIYSRRENRDSSNAVTAMDGVAAITITASWGPLEEVTVHEDPENIAQMYGSSGTVSLAEGLFTYGVKKVFVCRLGSSGGRHGTIVLNDNGASAKPVITLTQKYLGARVLSVTVREKLTDNKYKELIVYEGTKELEKLEFEAGSDEPALLTDVVNSKSTYFTAAAAEDTGTGVLAEIMQLASTGGADPAVTNGDYEAAFIKFEPYRFNTIMVDSTDHGIHLLLHEFIKRAYDTGAMFMGVAGLKEDIDFREKLKLASQFNDEKMVCVGNVYTDTAGRRLSGFEAAAVIGALISAVPSNQSIVHRKISDAAGIPEKLTNSQYEAAIKNGLLLFSPSEDDMVWIDSGVNTLVLPSEDQDKGWKKIKRTKIRFELMDRINRTISPLIGAINCDKDGIANVVRLGNGVLEEMVSENKLAQGASFYEDPSSAYRDDSAWFVIDADDIDTLEKIYLTYRFRFNAAS